MTLGFIVGRKYNRRKDIHERFSGQKQGGIITPSDHNVIFIISAKTGSYFGYDDKHLPDGRFDYYGQGQVGDMQMVRGNKTIRDHAALGNDLLLFESLGKGKDLVFRGSFVCESWRWGQSPDRNNDMRKAIIFELRNLENIVEELVDDDENATESVDLNELRTRAIQAAGSREGKPGARTIYERSRHVRDYVLARANGHCEGCGCEAPFLRVNGLPYLEPHHIRRVSDGGPDDPAFVIALCPTCHRKVHHGRDGAEYNDVLLRRMPSIEPPSTS
ncbi:HNH endonuclease [Brucella pituitosa]|uniref:HNH endonuclease n=1 Tax=Brucella pituitosa TaxID=571256 RepID=UPI0020035897|nr:HNH endonuclease [Brucella pituitosa]MCK4205275.1 HNH endonuclease [Brucella pituitosa]